MSDALTDTEFQQSAETGQNSFLYLSIWTGLKGRLTCCYLLQENKR